MSVPDALNGKAPIIRYPECPICDGELEDADNGALMCAPCGLYWASWDDDEPEYFDEYAEPCGYNLEDSPRSVARVQDSGCDWKTCPLPSGHTSHHYIPLTPKEWS